MKSTIKLNNLISLIKYYIKFSYKIYILGFSYGAITLYGAILKLKMDLDEVLQEKLKLIYFISIGSPIQIPKELSNNIYNIYNIKDFLGLFKYKKFNLPDLSTKYIKSLEFINYNDDDKDIIKYHYNETDKLIYVKFNYKTNNFHTNLFNVMIFFKNNPFIIQNYMMNILNSEIFFDKIIVNLILFINKDEIKIKFNDFVKKEILIKNLNKLDDKTILYLYLLYLEEIDIVDIDYKKINLNYLTFEDIKILCEILIEYKIDNDNLEIYYKCFNFLKKKDLNMLKEKLNFLFRIKFIQNILYDKNNYIKYIEKNFENIFKEINKLQLEIKYRILLSLEIISLNN